MNEEFSKGATAYMMQRQSSVSLNGPVSSSWAKHEVKIKSSGNKFVTVTGCGAPHRFLASDRPVLLSERGGAYLVSTIENADKLLAKLSEAAVEAAQ